MWTVEKVDQGASEPLSVALGVCARSFQSTRNVWAGARRRARGEARGLGYVKSTKADNSYTATLELNPL